MAAITVVAGLNDLLYKYPNVAKQYSKENKIEANNIYYATHKHVLWECEYGHTWDASVLSRTIKNTNCPYCAGRKVKEGFNDLQSQRPELANEYDTVLNKDLKAIPKILCMGF